ncbi:MAG: META domain-containing protein [Anaerolineales bacterium]|nr:META domain-containing protein [Anaerolineales bacterium]
MNTQRLPGKSLALVLLILLMMMAACGPAGTEGEPAAVETPTTEPEPTTEPTTEPTDEPVVDNSALDGTTWSLLHTIVGGDAIVPVSGNVIAWLSFADGTVSGQSGCNLFSGSATIAGDKLSFGPLAGTRMACEDELMSFESNFLDLLGQVDGFTLTDDTLELHNTDGLPLALFGAATEQTLFVGPEQVDCTGVGPQKCLLVKESADAEYTYFYDAIVGFTWEEGFEYELVVRVVNIPEPPMDASSLRYELVEIVSQTEVANAAPELTDIAWQWTQTDSADEAMAIEVGDPSLFSITFLPGGDYALQNDCNRGGGAYTLDGASLTIMPGFTTEAYCGDESLDQTFLNHLAQVVSYEVAEGQLILTLAEAAGTMTFTPAP